MTDRACDGCITRSWLLGRLAGHLERARGRIDQVLDDLGRFDKIVFFISSESFVQVTALDSHRQAQRLRPSLHIGNIVWV